MTTSYYIVISDPDNVWSATNRSLVSNTNTTYMNWIASGGKPGILPNMIAVKSLFPPITQITPYEFKARFETSEWANIVSASQTDANVLSWVLDAVMVQTIDLTNPLVSIGLTYMSTISPSLIAASRIPVLLAAS